MGDAERTHLLGKLEDLAIIRQRTGVREVLVVPDSAGRFEEHGELLKGPAMLRRLLVGKPDTGTFLLVDLHFLK